MGPKRTWKWPEMHFPVMSCEVNMVSLSFHAMHVWYAMPLPKIVLRHCPQSGLSYNSIWQYFKNQLQQNIYFKEIYRWKVSAMLDCWGANSNWSFLSNLNFAWEDSQSLDSSKFPRGRRIICMCPFSQAAVLFYWQYINRPANSNWSFLSNFNFAWEAALILDSQTPNWQFVDSIFKSKILKADV